MKKKGFFGYLRSILGERKKTKNIEFQLSTETIEELKYRLKSLMDNQKPYLQRGYHMKDMADELQIPVYQLSAFINQVMGVHFTDYMNRFRVRHCEHLMHTEASKPNLKELVYKCGFNNRNSFAAAFKKFTGEKPSDYIKRLQNLNV